MAQPNLESLFSAEIELKQKTDNTFAPEFLEEMSVDFAEIMTLIDARDAVDAFLTLKAEGNLTAEQIQAEEQKLFEVVPQAVFAAAGGEEGASEGFWEKIKNKIGNFFTKTLPKLIKSMRDLDFSDQAKDLLEKIKDAPEFAEKKLTVTNLPSLTAKNGKTMWTAAQMVGILNRFSKIDDLFLRIWKIAGKENGGTFDKHIGGLAKTMFGFVGFAENGKMACGWNGQADEMLLSDVPVKSDHVEWFIKDWTNGKAGGLYDADSKKEIEDILKAVSGYEKGIEGLEKNAETTWEKAISSKLSKEDAQRIHNVMMFFYGVLSYLRSYVRQVLAYCKLHLALK